MTASSAPARRRLLKWRHPSTRRCLRKGVVHKTDDLTAEMCKLTENTFRDVNIAYANELSVICDKMGIDVLS